MIWIKYRLLDEESKRVAIEAELNKYNPNIQIPEIDVSR